MKDTDDTVFLTMRQKLEAEHAPSNQDTDPLEKGKPANFKTDDWPVTLLSSLWHQSCDQSAKKREIVESNVNPEEAEIAHSHASGTPQTASKAYCNTSLQFGDDELGQYVPALLKELCADRLLTKSTSSALYYIRAYPPSFPYSEPTVSCRPCKPVIDVNERRAQLQRFLGDDLYAGQHQNIRKALSLYDEEYVPSVESVFIQMGKVVSIDELVLVRTGLHTGRRYAYPSFLLLLLLISF